MKAVLDHDGNISQNVCLTQTLIIQLFVEFVFKLDTLTSVSRMISNFPSMMSIV